MKTGFLYGIVACSKTRVRCVLCGVHIPKANKCIEQHTNGAKHKENVELMTENGITFKDNKLYCKPCMLELSLEDSVIGHTEAESHLNWMAAMEDLIDGEYISIEPFLASEKDDALCEVCHSTFQCTLQNIESHVNSINHRTSISEYLKPLNGIFPVENDDELWCKICNTFIENTATGILEHIDNDEQHMYWFTTIEDLIEEQDITIKSFLANEFDNNAYCNKCHLEINCNARSLEDHINSDIHLSHFS
ncbi:unnamed protein product [Diatraea saccharalis]|uniref:U1-type domain-containing protein n=1 Tax=Diatraea saccharalis TaxID=40085 RepID=A0A9N9QTH6_9NEOP|nr:unnamed protein product [Diatraea saccharalis]